MLQSSRFISLMVQKESRIILASGQFLAIYFFFPELSAVTCRHLQWMEIVRISLVI